MSRQSKSPGKRRKKFNKHPSALRVRHSRAVQIPDLQDLVLYTLTSYDKAPEWVKLQNRRAIDKVVMIEVPGLTPEDFGFDSSNQKDLGGKVDPTKVRKELAKLPCLQDLVPMHLPKQRSVVSLFPSLVAVKLSKRQRHELAQQGKGQEATLDKLCLNLGELLANNYPIHQDVPGATQEMVSDYRGTSLFEHKGGKVFALDCEMCLSENGQELTRVSLTDWDGRAILDTLVQPKSKITDYLTVYSGITEEMLEGVTTTFEDVQNMLCEKVSSDDILIGHSLDSDLGVLKLKHPRIIDTAICYDNRGNTMAKPSLKQLMKVHIKEDVHNKPTGHDSTEDCQCCLKLVKRKLEHGMGYGKAFNFASLFDRIATTNKLERALDGAKVPKSSLVVDRMQKKSIGYLAHHILAPDESSVLNALEDKLQDHDFVYAQYHGIETAHLENESDQSAAYTRFANKLAKIYEIVPANSIVIVTPGSVLSQKLKNLQQKRRDFQKAFRNNPNVKNGPDAWTDQNERELALEIDNSKNSFLLISLKQPATPPSTNVTDTSMTVDPSTATETGNDVSMKTSDSEAVPA